MPAAPGQPRVDPLAMPAAADRNAPPALTDAAPSPSGPTNSSLEKAKMLLMSGNFPAARKAAEEAKAQGAGLEADAVVTQVAQTEQQAAMQMYESVLASLRKGSEADMSHARDMLGELSTLNLDESTQQKVQDLLARLPRDGAGQAQIGSALDDKEAVEAQKLNAEVGHQGRRGPPPDGDRPRQGHRAAQGDDGLRSRPPVCKETVTRTMTRRLEVAIELAKKDKVAFDQKMKDKAFKAEIERKRLRILEADKAKKERMKSTHGEGPDRLRRRQVRGGREVLAKRQRDRPERDRGPRRRHVARDTAL